MSKKLPSIFFILALCLSTACSNSPIWEETKTATRYVNKKGLAILNQDKDSKLVQNKSEFLGPQDEEFIPLKDQDAKSHLVETTNLQPKDFARDAQGQIPQMKQFKDPSAGLGNIFKSVFFNTDDDMLRSKEYFQTIQKITQYLKTHPSVYLFISGHCDERASDSYNLALGSRRANFVRTLLIKEGVSSDRIYTISYGKQQPLVQGQNKTAWAKNRRVEFKIFDKNSKE